MSRTIRYSTLIPQPPTPLSALVIGVGAIGSQLATLLARGGHISTLTLVDPDTVSALNLGPQCYNPDEVGKPKVTALATRLAAANPDLTLLTHEDSFTPAHLLDPAGTPYSFVFICVDLMSVRRQIGEALTPHIPHTRAIIDGRMGAEILQILTFTDTAPYLSTVFPDSEAIPLPCSARATPHCPCIAASFMFHHFTLFLRGTTPPPTLMLDLPSLTLDTPPLTAYAPECPASLAS